LHQELCGCSSTWISDDITVERYSESYLDEIRHNLDWSVITDRHDHLRLLMPPAVALVFLDAARPDLVEALDAGSAAVTGGRTTIRLDMPEDIDRAIALIQKLNVSKPEKGADKKKKKADAKKEAKGAKPKKFAKKSYRIHISFPQTQREYVPTCRRALGVPSQLPSRLAGSNDRQAKRLPVGS
jgi:hypothetical protein